MEIYERVFVPAMMEWAAPLMALTSPQPEDCVLDVACGTGALTRAAVNAIGRGGRVVGLDINSDMLAVARTIPMGGPRSVPVEWREGDVNALPFEDEIFDVVFCSFGLMFFPTRSRP